MTLLAAGGIGYIATRGHAPTATGTAPGRSIAVLPFVNMSSDPEQDFFSDGISEELLNLLAKIPELRVAARTPSFSFKGQKLEIPEIARRLKVAHILEGSVRKSPRGVDPPVAGAARCSVTLECPVQMNPLWINGLTTFRFAGTIVGVGREAGPPSGHGPGLGRDLRARNLSLLEA